MYFLLIINLITLVLIICQAFLLNKSIKTKTEWIKSNEELIKLLTDLSEPKNLQGNQIEIVIQKDNHDKVYN